MDECIEITVEGDLITVRIDLSKAEPLPSASGRSLLIASTHGGVPLKQRRYRGAVIQINISSSTHARANPTAAGRSPHIAEGSLMYDGLSPRV